MAKVHMVLQGKGGVGKSMIAATLAQYINARAPSESALCIDTDPVNATFAGYETFKVHRLEIMEEMEISSRKFDELVTLISEAKGDVVIDNGASTFVPLSHYLISNDVPHLLLEMGHELIIHTVITGGQSLLDTLNGFSQLASQFPAEAKFVVWLNPFLGEVAHEGKPFDSMKAYQQNKERVSAIIRIPTLKQETHGRDFSDMLKRRHTLDHAISDTTLGIMPRQRLKLVKAQLFDQLNAAAVI